MPFLTGLESGTPKSTPTELLTWNIAGAKCEAVSSEEEGGHRGRQYFTHCSHHPVHRQQGWVALHTIQQHLPTTTTSTARSEREHLAINLLDSYCWSFFLMVKFSHRFFWL